MKSLDEILRLAELHEPSPRISVAAAEDIEVLHAVKEAVKRNLAHFILYGNREKIYSLADEARFSLTGTEVVHADSPDKACLEAVQAVSEGSAEIVMKGLVDTATMLRAVLDKEVGLRTGRVLSHVAVFEIPRHDKLLLVTDAAMNIAPTLEQKVHIIENAKEIAQFLDIKSPLVAVIAAVETVSENMPATLDAALLSKMADRGQIKGVEIEGPLGLDNAISLRAAHHKGIYNQVAGRADILLVPNIESGNILYKSLMYFAGSKMGGIIAGAGAPIILTSRADTHTTKLFSIGLAAWIAHSKQREVEKPIVYS